MRHWITALRHSHNRIATLVEPLNAEQIRGPSYHDWTIAEVLSHLGSGAEIGVQWLEAGLNGSEPPGRETFPPVWDAWNARTPEQQVADGVMWNEQYMQRFESATNEELARFHLSLFGMELDAKGMARLRLGEHAVHAWDVEVAFDRGAEIAPDAVDLLIDTLSRVAGRGGKPQGKQFQLHVRTSQPERSLLLSVGEAVELTEWNDSTVDGELLLPAEAFIRLVYGRLDADTSPEVELTAPGVTLDDLRSIFPGI